MNKTNLLSLMICLLTFISFNCSFAKEGDIYGTLVPHGAGGGACSIIREVSLLDGSRLKGCEISYIDFEEDDLVDEKSALIAIRKFHADAVQVEFFY